ncbi:MAG: cell wall hydrolase [Limnochordales bacterium]|nr:cell wall hydrolase [Limnochordales bacterium]
MFLLGLLALSSLIPVLVLAGEVQLPPDEPKLAPGRSETAASPSLSSKPQPQPQSPRQPEKNRDRDLRTAEHQHRERGRTSEASQPAAGQAAMTTSSRTDVPARGWLTPAEWELLARAVYAEARGEPLEGQVAVAAVILNRRDDPRFPDRIADIIYQPGAFEAVADGQINLKPDANAYRAVALALKGWDPTNGALYYWNPARTTNRWIWSRPVLRVIGQHWFAR